MIIIVCVTVNSKMQHDNGNDNNYLVVWSRSSSCLVDGASSLNNGDKHQSGNASYNDPQLCSGQ